jgi:hypothetical protein
VVFLSLGLPAASVLARLVMTADGARREQIAQKHLELNATKNWKYNNKRQPDVLDDQRDHWIDKLLSDQILSAKTSLRSSANAFVEPVTLGSEAIEAALRASSRCAAESLRDISAGAPRFRAAKGNTSGQSSCLGRQLEPKRTTGWPLGALSGLGSGAL